MRMGGGGGVVHEGGERYGVGDVGERIEITELADVAISSELIVCTVA